MLGAATGALLVAVILGPFWFLYRKYRGWGYSDEERANPFSSLRLPRRRRLSTPTSLAFRTLLGAALGAWFGVWFTGWIDLAEESARGALYFGAAGLVVGLGLRLITLAFRKRAV